MKEPKFPKLDELPPNNKYNFFADGLFPEDNAEKRQKNRSSHKKSRLPFSLPINDPKRLPNTQKEDDLVPYFAKDYPPSSESKEEICLINSPPPSDTPADTGGEAEEVEIEEDESDENNNKKNKNDKKNNNDNSSININNDEIGVSVEFNSELENEYEKQSKMLSREEVQGMIKKNEERKKEKKLMEEKRKKIEEEEKKRQMEEEKKKEIERKRKEKEEKEEKERIEREKEKERLKKIEEDKNEIDLNELKYNFFGYAKQNLTTALDEILDL